MTSQLRWCTLPTQTLGPVCQKKFEGLGDRALTVSPRQKLDDDPMTRTLDSPSRVQEFNEVSPKGNEAVSPLLQPVIAGRRFPALRAQAPAVFSMLDIHDHALAFQADLVSINKTLDRIALIE